MEANNKQVHVDSIDEEIVARVAGIDVAKDSGMVCTRVPHQSQPGKRTTTVWSVSARTNSIIELADRLALMRHPRAHHARVLGHVDPSNPGHDLLVDRVDVDLLVVRLHRSRSFFYVTGNDAGCLEAR